MFKLNPFVMYKRILMFSAFALLVFFSKAQNVVWPAESIMELTSEWTGERTPDGRPKVSDQLLERLKALSMEEVWASLGSRGYRNQFENFSGTIEN
jgi:hypothetical protein